MVPRVESLAWFIFGIFFSLFTVSLYVKQQIYPEKIEQPTTKPITYDVDQREKFCLAQNIHYEAAGEPFIGKLAVAFVTLNRKNQTGSTICKVVFEPYQFSWTLNPERATKFSDDVWLAADLAIKNLVRLTYLEQAVYFHNHTVNPAWLTTKKKVAVIGNHIFYAEK
jgi:N-acetylmuramoyl-L-alanine amidase